jgi:hypothetical protein
MNADGGDAANPEFDDGVLFGLDSLVSCLRRCQRGGLAG